MTNEVAPNLRLSSLERRKALDGGWVIGAVAKRTYEVRGGRCVIADEQLPLVEEPEMGEDGLLEHDSDRILQRRFVDVVVTGHARCTTPSPSFTVSVEIAGHRRDIAVFGDRELRLEANGSVSISRPAPITEVPLRWENAYGGVDRALLAEIGDPFMRLAEKMGEKMDPEQSMFAYPRNPHGRGYLLEPSAAAIAATKLPNLEDPSFLLTGESIVRVDPLYWPIAPRPACTTWMPYVHFPRSAQIGLPFHDFARERIATRDFAEVREGLLREGSLAEGVPMAARIDVACAQASAPGMRWPELLPGAPVALGNVHPTLPVWQWTLPLERPRMAYRVPGMPAVELAPAIRSVEIRPDEDLVTILWVGEERMRDAVSDEQLRRAEYGLRWTTP